MPFEEGTYRVSRRRSSIRLPGSPTPTIRSRSIQRQPKRWSLLFPKQNQATGARLDVPNFVTNVPGSFSINGFDVRGDHVFNSNHKMFARYTHKNTARDGTNGSGSYNTLAGTYSRPINVRNLAGSYNWIVSPNLINEFRAGYSFV